MRSIVVERGGLHLNARHSKEDSSGREFREEAQITSVDDSQTTTVPCAAGFL